MPGAIGSLNAFASWAGEIQGMTPSVEIYQRAGSDGVGMLVSGSHGAMVAVRTSFHDTLVNCQAHRAACEALVGDVVSATDALGTTFTDTAVVSVSTSVVAARGLGGTATHICFAEWQLVPEA